MAVTTDAPFSRAERISVRAGSMPPMTSMTRSTSSRATRPAASEVKQLARDVDLALQLGAAHRDADELEGHPDARGEVVVLLAQQPDDLAADGAAPEQREPQRLAGVPVHLVILS